MKIVSYGPKRQERTGILLGQEVIDLNMADGGLPTDPRDLYSGWDRFQPLLKELSENMAQLPVASRLAISEIRLGAPSPYPGEIVCLAGNYEEHIKEGECVREFKPTEHPKLFSKAGVTANGPADDIIYPHGVEKLDYEVELAVIISRPCHKVSAKEALDSVAGFCVLNDISARCAQFSDGQFFRGKSFEGSCPMGPALITTDQAGDTTNLNLCSRVNGEIRQNSSTAKMTYKVPEIIEFISAIFTLMPGDVIATGTPAGVGVFMEPPALLAPGDLVEVEIEGLGILRNKIITPQQEQ